MTTSKLSKAQLATLRGMLEKKRATLRVHIERDRSTTSEDNEALSDPMDAATHETDAADILMVDENEQGLLEAIERALAKFEEGTYGLSEESGEPIPYARLQAVPWARFLVEEEEELEKG